MVKSTASIPSCFKMRLLKNGRINKNNAVTIKLLMMEMIMLVFITFAALFFCAMTLLSALGMPICASVISKTMVGDAREYRLIASALKERANKIRTRKDNALAMIDTIIK